MKVQCDVCAQAEASVFCCADEAALCRPCDLRIHRANKLAGKHRRLSLQNPSSSSSPSCDICQDKRAFLFCQEDRAILCKDCDASIHAANELTKKHNRFLLTGVRLSATEEELAPAVVVGPDSAIKKRSSSSSCNTEKAIVEEEEDVCGNSSSIFDYLMKTLPGWRVDDLLLDVPSPLSPFPFSNPVYYKMGLEGEDALPGVETSVDAPVWWVPQVPQENSTATAFGFQHGGGVGVGGGWRGDDGFIVPEMATQQQSSNKRPRTLW